MSAAQTDDLGTVKTMLDNIMKMYVGGFQIDPSESAKASIAINKLADENEDLEIVRNTIGNVMKMMLGTGPQVDVFQVMAAQQKIASVTESTD